MRLKPKILAATLFTSAAAQAELPIPSQVAARQNAQAYLFHAGAGDVFEISSSMMAIQNSQNPGVRAFASMLIADHTNLSNTTPCDGQECRRDATATGAEHGADGDDRAADEGRLGV